MLRRGRAGPSSGLGAEGAPVDGKDAGDAAHAAAADAGGAAARVTEDQGGLAPNGNSVSLEDEMVKNAETKRQHDISIAVYRSSLTMLRTAMGRRG